MKKNYVNPMTKVITLNCNTIMEAQADVVSTPNDTNETTTEAPLF